MPTEGTRPQEHILLAATDPSMILLLTDLFTRAGFAVETVSSSSEVLNRLGAGHPYTKLVVERDLPGASDLQDQLRASGDTIPVISFPIFSPESTRVLLAGRTRGRLTFIDLLGLTAQNLVVLAGGMIGVFCVIMFEMGLEWQLGWLPIFAALVGLEPLLDRAGLKNEETGRDTVFWLYILLFATSVAVWVSGMLLS